MSSPLIPRPIIQDWPAPRLLGEALRAVEAIPPDKKAAVVIFAEGNTDTGVKMGAGVMVKLKNDWKFVGRVDKEWKGPLSGSVSLVKTW